MTLLILLLVSLILFLLYVSYSSTTTTTGKTDYRLAPATAGKKPGKPPSPPSHGSGPNNPDIQATQDLINEPDTPVAPLSTKEKAGAFLVGKSGKTKAIGTKGGQPVDPPPSHSQPQPPVPPPPSQPQPPPPSQPQPQPQPPVPQPPTQDQPPVQPGLPLVTPTPSLKPFETTGTLVDVIDSDVDDRFYAQQARAIIQRGLAPPLKIPPVNATAEFHQ